MQSKKVTVAQNDVILTHCYMFSVYQLRVELLPSAHTAHCPRCSAAAAAATANAAVATRHRHHKMRHGYYTPPCVLARFV